MKLFRNPEIRQSLLFYVVIAATAVAVSSFSGGKAMLFTIIVIAACVMIHLQDICRRNRRIAELTKEIDILLHEGKRLEISRYKEGELSLLADELGKMTVRLEEQADRLVSDKKYLADSMADISHQIKTPLTSLQLHLETVSQNMGNDEKQRRHIREIRRILDQMGWLVSALLKIAKLDAGAVIMKQEAVSLETLLRHAAAPMEILMELKNQQLVIDAQGSVAIDFSWTEEAVRNVIKNCVEHMEEGMLYLTARENPIYSEIVIRDTGIGIDKEDLPHLFERFYKGKNSSEQSAGIGLALARMIIAQQNGTIRAQNHPEGGAVFEIRFYKSSV